MGHSHHHHAVGAKHWLLAALVMTVALVAAEFIAGMKGHSLSLVSDGWHNLSDLPPLFFAWLAIVLEQKPPDHQRTFGYQRAGVLAAFVNALILAAVAAAIAYEGYERIRHPAPVASGLMIVIGAAALAVNGVITLGMVRGRGDINVRAIFIHSLGDALSDVAIICGAILMRVLRTPLIDPLLGLLIAAMILWSAVGILEESGSILLESLPKGMSVADVANAILAVEGVEEVHDVHIWSLNPHSHTLACHVRILDMPTSESEMIIHKVQRVLHDKFDIAHSTIQVEHTHPPGEFHTYMPEPARSRHSSS